MKQTRSISAIGLILRGILTVVILYAFGQAFLALQILNTHNRNAESYAAMKQAHRRGEDRASSSTRRRVKTPWPKYPGAIRSISLPGAMNGVQLVTEEMRVRARPELALAYFRRSMQSRGWEDITEEYFGLRPDAVDCTGAYRNLQDERFIERYDTVMRTHACFRRHGESVMIRTSENDPPEDGRYRLSLSHLGTGSMLEFAQNIGRRMAQAGTARRPVSVMKNEQYFGRDLYKNELISSALTMKSLGAKMKRRMRLGGWKEVPMDPELAPAMAPGGPQITTFAKGERMAMVTVAPGPEGQGSSGMITEIAARED